ncbi:MAG: sugar transferase [Paracoccaceae bacterium]|nr:sugar transferase [Paracoccaceae bacterium]
MAVRFRRPMTGLSESGTDGLWDVAPATRGGYKRPFDLAVVGLMLVLLAPLWVVLGLAVILAVRLEDGGPVLYRQVRLGRGGAVFRILKFRTLAVGAETETGPVWTERGNPRITRVGRVLRRFHLDELPQAVNILKGEMSVVGPRPERPELAARIEQDVPGFAARLRVRPGVAGLAQAEGAGWQEPALKLHYDNLYIAAMSPWLDLRLCARCLARTLRPRRGGP